MANSSFIDGLKTRSEKSSDSVSHTGSRFATGHNSYESGDPLFSRPQKRNIGSAVERTVYKKPAKKNEDLSKKIERIAKTQKNEGFVKRETRSLDANRPKRSYARDILGVEDDELEFDDEDLKRARRERKLAKKQKNKKKNKKKFIFRHKIFSFIIMPILIILVVVFIWGNSIILRITNGKSNLIDLIRTVVSGNATLNVGHDGRTNVLIFGTSGYDMQGSEGDGAHDGAQLTDSIMVLSIDQNTKDVAMVSLPRDLKTDTCTVGNKINELYYCANKDGNNEVAGAKALKERVEEILGIEVQYYAHINWMSLIKIVDSIGGITVTLDEDINDEWTKTYIKAGTPVNLNGESALGLARARHGTENGDFTRGNSQQKIMIGIKEKISANGLGLYDLINLANILGDNLRSDFTSDTIYAGAKIFTESSFESIRQIPLIGSGSNYLTTGNINGISYVFPIAGQSNYSNIQKYLKQALLKNPIILENAQLAILNGSGVSGLAEKEKKELEKSIFNIKYTGDAPSGNYFENIYLYAVSDKPATKERLETYYGTKARDGEFMPSGIDKNGVDFVIILGIGYTAD